MTIRVVGPLVAVLGLGLLVWVPVTLGANFSPRLDLGADPALVDHGPYRWVRHPLYTSGFVSTLEKFLLSGNLVLLFVPGETLTLLVALRLHDEEAMTLDRFGAAYRSYPARTGRLLRRVRK